MSSIATTVYIAATHTQHNSLPMQINMHSTTDYTAFHNPPLHTANKHKAYLCDNKMAQDVGMV